MTRRVHGLSEISKDYRAIFCDVWGVVHNGQTAYEDAGAALSAFRSENRSVVLLTNSPRPAQGVIAQLDDLGVSREAYDAVVTSGDATRTLIEQASGDTYHLGPDRDLPLFEGIKVSFTNAETADHIVCTGLFEDETETPEDYRERLSTWADRKIPMICANPDVIVERGDRMIWCAGALANLYKELGGEVLVAGKPNKPIYDLAFKKLEELAAGHSDKPQKKDVIAIGDGLPTDVAGAINNGFDLLYISAGIHHTNYGPPENPDEAALVAFLNENEVDPTFWMPRLSWSQSAA